MNDIKNVAGYFKENQEKIISVWRERVKNVVPAASQQTDPALLNHLPDFLQNLTNILSDSSSCKNHIQSELGREHGKQRAQLTGYSLKQVLLEYYVLRDVILELLNSKSLLSYECQNLVLHSFDAGVIEAASQFTEVRKAQTDQALSTSKSNERDLEVQRDFRELFVFTLSHDLRTPLTSIKLQAEMLMRLHSDVKTLQMLSKMIERADSAESMIRDLLDANRIKAGEPLPLEIKECDLRKIIDHTIEDLAVTSGDRFVFRSSVDQYLGYWSCKGLRRILDNLCNNAVKYGTPHSLITIQVDKDEDHIFLSVHNSGDPIPEEEQKLIFDPFRRTRTAQSGTQKGWGLGLTLVRGLAEAHGGEISVESNKEKGTTFTVKLPIDGRQINKG